MKQKPILDPNFKQYRAVISFSSWINGEVIKKEVRIVGERIYGYDIHGDGGWGLHKIRETDSPARFIAYIPKGHRNIRIMNIKGVKIEPIHGAKHEREG